MENVKEIIAKNLTELRKANKLTQGALAEKLNYSDKAISRWEHAETLPDIETLCKIETALELSLLPQMAETY
jgi:tellurite methyltransferase